MLWKVKSFLLFIIVEFICCIFPECYSILSFSSPMNADYYSDPVLLEVVNSEFTVEKNEIEQLAKEVEIESERPVININYILGFSHILPTEDSETRGKILIDKKEGIPTTFLNRRVILRGRPGPDDPNERKKYIKNYMKENIRKTIYKEYFSLLIYNIEKIDSYNYKLNLTIKANEKIENCFLRNTKVLIFLVVSEVKSEVSSSLVHKNVAYKFIPVEGFENEEFDGTGNPLYKIINRNTIYEGDEIEIKSTEFNIDKSINNTWNIVVIIENNKRREILLTRKLRLNDN